MCEMVSLCVHCIRWQQHRHTQAIPIQNQINVFQTFSANIRLSCRNRSFTFDAKRMQHPWTLESRIYDMHQHPLRPSGWYLSRCAILDMPFDFEAHKCLNKTNCQLRQLTQCTRPPAIISQHHRTRYVTFCVRSKAGRCTTTHSHSHWLIEHVMKWGRVHISPFNTFIHRI